MPEKSLSELMAEHNKKIRDANAKQIEKSEAIHIKKNPNASTKFGSPYVIKYGDEVDYFS